MAIQVAGTTVISNTRGLNNIASLDATTIATINENISAALPDPSYENESGTLSKSTTYTFTHGLGALPKHVTFSYVCVTAEKGWAVGDEVPFTLGTENYNANVGPIVAVNGTQIKVRIGSNSNARPHGFDGSSRSHLVPSKWKIKVRAWK